jgi:hypothetical protein
VKHVINYLNCTPTHLSKTAVLDSGCMGHFLVANAHCLDKATNLQPLQVNLPNGQVIASIHTATIDLPSLSTAARQAHILTGLAQYSLLSVGQICDSGCEICFTTTVVTVKAPLRLVSSLTHSLLTVWLSVGTIRYPSLQAFRNTSRAPSLSLLL